MSGTDTSKAFDGLSKEYSSIVGRANSSNYEWPAFSVFVGCPSYLTALKLAIDSVSMKQSVVEVNEPLSLSVSEEE
jgi:hypothetical protein